MDILRNAININLLRPLNLLITEIRSQKGETSQRKNDERKIDEESLQLYGLVKKIIEKLMNQLSNCEELQCERSLNRNR